MINETKVVCLLSPILCWSNFFLIRPILALILVWLKKVNCIMWISAVVSFHALSAMDPENSLGHSHAKSWLSWHRDTQIPVRFISHISQKSFKKIVFIMNGWLLYLV
jgi:hypothetical protein